MNRRQLVLGGAGALVIPLPGCRPQPAGVHLRMATQYNPSQPIGKGYDRWAQAVADRSAGRISVRVFRNRTLIDSAESFAAVSSGSVDVSNMIAGFQTGDIPDLAGLQIPFLFDDQAHYRRVLRAGFFDMLAAEYAKHKIKLLNLFPKGDVHFFHHSKFLENPESFMGQNIRTVGGYQSKMVEILGASALTLPGSEVMSSLQRGVINGLITNYDGYIGYNWYRDARYVFKIAAAQDGEGLGINLDLFNRLPADLQTVVTDAGREMEDAEWDEITRIDGGGADRKWKELGLSVKGATEDQRSAFRKSLRPLIETAAAELPLVDTLIKLAAATRQPT